MTAAAAVQEGVESASASAEAAVASAAVALKAAAAAAAAAAKAKAKATAAEAVAKEAARRGAAAVDAAQAAEAAAMGINWRSKMLDRIANADADLPTVPWPKVPGSITSQCKDWGNPVIFADTPPTLLALRVPLGSKEKLEAVRILKTLGEYMGLGRVGDEHKGKFKFFERLRFSGRYMSPEDGGADARPNWFVIAESSVGAFRAAARENLEEMTRTVSESNVDKKKLEKASTDKTLLNCTACSSSLLAHDDPQFDVKVCVLADVCHGGFLKPCAKCRP